MDDATEALYLQKIEEFVHDDDLIITTEYLCRKLVIPIKDAKHLIRKYLADQRDVRPKELGVHYVVLGKLIKEDKLCVLLVAETELNGKLSLFQSGFSKEIYSIQKALNTDISALNLLNPEPKEKALVGSIVGKNCIASRKFVSKKSLAPEKQKLQLVKNDNNTRSIDIKVKLDENIIEKKTSPSKIKITNRPVQTGKGIANLFQKMAEKPKIANKKPPVEETTKIIDKPVGNPKKNKPLFKLIDTDDENDEETPKVIESPKEQLIKQKSTGSSRKPSKKRTRKEVTPEKSLKRRKRVIEPQSDSDDDIFGDASDNEKDVDITELPLEPAYKPLKYDPSAPKNKQKKYVSKSYVDEDGYMVTKQEWLPVSGSEDEDMLKEQEAPNVSLNKPVVKKIDEKKEKKTAEDKKELPSTKGKGKNAKKPANQPSILSFFNKK